MYSVNVREARERISRLLSEVERGEEIIISRHGRPIARLVPVERESRFSDRSGFRASLPSGRTGSADLVRKIRDEERY